MADRPSLADLHTAVPFADRHVGISAAAEADLLSVLGYGTAAELIDAAVPADIRDGAGLDLPAAATEAEALSELASLAAGNEVLTSMIGLGYHDTITPAVIRRNVLENPSWYTAYTPYQPEISQGRLEALLNFQTMVEDLTGLAFANASLLDEATAAAEALSLARRATRGAGAFLIDADALPQTVAVIRTRAAASGVEVVVADLSSGELPGGDFFGVLLQYPGASGAVRDLAPVVEAAHERGMLAIVAADLLASTMLRAPGEFGADIAVGSTQRFGMPMGFGGPHAGYMAVRDGLQRSLPGRLVGVSKDADGAPAYRLALQTREQHIRREKATSNICTAQVLPAVVSSMYAVYHGPQGLHRIAQRVHRYAAILARGLRDGGVDVVHDSFFDTVLARVPGQADAVVRTARERGVNLRRVDGDHVGIACDEATVSAHVEAVWASFGVSGHTAESLDPSTEDAVEGGLLRTSEYLTHPVFNSHRSETSMLRYLHRLADKDYGLDRGMIPLGSCTMKLNAAAEMEPISWPGFARIHPFAPADQVGGYTELIERLSGWLVEATGYDAVSLQPNAGSQGELAGLLAIHAYHQANGDTERDVCLIPSSAHGTNAASAVMAGMRVAVVGCDDGNVDLTDLQALLDEHEGRVAAIMITYPSTHGVYERTVAELCAMVHDAGGQVYIDGANLNALLGIAKPGRFGGDVSHLNLHKTFCIPHGGGGPGVGPVAARGHLAPYLPDGTNPVAAAPYGSAGILPITWAYIRMMGAPGLVRATQAAVLAANYVAKRLEGHYPVLYAGRRGLVAHECILDLRKLTKDAGVTVDDVAKRLIDYGFHAPTMSFPVAGTLMVEPTESEDLAELDRFCAAMIAIRAEINRVAAGEWPKDDNPLRNAPHTAASVTGDWEHAYTREEAVFPTRDVRAAKYWTPVRRIDQAYGDRNLVCACPPVEELAGE
ncbi:MAG: aminomethyl-transferring glycine dehydrogenase [Streptosporangiales bacterium]|nr:aminomethyl-transferring glycine dehydrogenase [Streptosporangiales bacterium]MBO0890416.1 aminomethyl-transferring glycine dehydrogenase [Acidothermales bacterium]